MNTKENKFSVLKTDLLQVYHMKEVPYEADIHWPVWLFQSTRLAPYSLGRFTLYKGTVPKKHNQFSIGFIKTLRGNAEVFQYDWIIHNGMEIYPVRPDHFKKKYQEVVVWKS